MCVCVFFIPCSQFDGKPYAKVHNISASSLDRLTDWQIALRDYKNNKIAYFPTDRL